MEKIEKVYVIETDDGIQLDYTIDPYHKGSIDKFVQRELRDKFPSLTRGETSKIWSVYVNRGYAVIKLEIKSAS